MAEKHMTNNNNDNNKQNKCFAITINASAREKELGVGEWVRVP